MTVKNETARDKKVIKRVISMGWLLPNLMTVAALSFGLTGLRFAFSGKWAEMLFMLVLAILFDTLDGRVARLLRSTSQFGAQLDSLSDSIVFGVVPAISLYLWGLQPANKIAWTATLFFCVCSVLRLARFNSELQEETDKSKMFFTGIPMPAAGFLVLLPMVLYLEFDYEFLRDWRLIASWMILIGLGSISIIPTYAGKTFILPRRFAVPLLSSFAIIAAGVFIKPWMVWTVLSIIYILHIPVAGLVYVRMKGKLI